MGTPGQAARVTPSDVTEGWLSPALEGEAQPLPVTSQGILNGFFPVLPPPGACLSRVPGHAGNLRSLGLSRKTKSCLERSFGFSSPLLIWLCHGQRSLPHPEHQGWNWSTRIAAPWEFPAFPTAEFAVISLWKFLSSSSPVVSPGGRILCPQGDKRPRKLSVEGRSGWV